MTCADLSSPGKELTAMWHSKGSVFEAPENADASLCTVRHLVKQEWVCNILRGIAYTFIYIYYLSLVLTHHPAVTFHVLMGCMAGLRHPWNSTGNKCTSVWSAALIQWAHLHLNQSGKYVTGSCFPSRIWGYFKLVRDCWSDNYSRGKRLRFLHQLGSGAWKSWCWAAESTWRLQWKHPVKAVHPWRAGKVGHGIIQAVKSYIYQNMMKLRPQCSWFSGNTRMWNT